MFVHALENLKDISASFGWERVVQAQLRPLPRQYSQAESTSVYQRLLVRARGLLGVRSASLSLTSFHTGSGSICCLAIEESGAESFLQQIREELITNTYRPMRARKKEIPKDGGTKVRVLSIPSIRDRVVQGALKLILEPIFEADFQSGSYGYRPKRTAHEAVARVAQAIVEEKTRIIDWI